MEPDDLDDAIGMLYATIIQLPDLDPILRPVILRLEKYRDAHKVVERGSTIDLSRAS